MSGGFKALPGCRMMWEDMHRVGMRTFASSSYVNDGGLKSILTKESEHERSTYESPEELRNGPPEPFTLTEMQGDTLMTLTRAYGSITWEKPHILLLDEPSNHLDIDSIDALLLGLSEFSEAGGGILMISHDQYLIEEFLHDEETPHGEIWEVVLGQGHRSIQTFPGSFRDYKKKFFT